MTPVGVTSIKWSASSAGLSKAEVPRVDARTILTLEWRCWRDNSHRNDSEACPLVFEVEESLDNIAAVHLLSHNMLGCRLTRLGCAHSN